MLKCLCDWLLVPTFSPHRTYNERCGYKRSLFSPEGDRQWGSATSKSQTRHAAFTCRTATQAGAGPGVGTGPMGHPCTPTRIAGRWPLLLPVVQVQRYRIFSCFPWLEPHYAGQKENGIEGVRFGQSAALDSLRVVKALPPGRAPCTSRKKFYKPYLSPTELDIDSERLSGIRLRPTHQSRTSHWKGCP